MKLNANPFSRHGDNKNQLLIGEKEIVFLNDFPTPKNYFPEKFNNMRKLKSIKTETPASSGKTISSS